MKQKMKTNTQETTMHEIPFLGYIPIPRNSLGGPFWNIKRKFSKFELYFYLHSRAQYTEHKPIDDRGELISLKEGQLLTSYLSLSKVTGRTPGWVKRTISMLVELRILKIVESNNRRLILEVVESNQIRKIIQENKDQKMKKPDKNSFNKSIHTNKEIKDKKENNENSLDIENLPIKKIDNH